MSERSEPLTRKREHLLTLLQEWHRVGVAFSAGVDSTVVAQAAQLACGEAAVAFTAVSPSLASGELAEAEELANLIGIRHELLHTEEIENPLYVQNSGDRCYHCKTELYTQMEARCRELGIPVLLNGANLDDRGDHRPGLQAASEFQVRSPLIEAGFNKEDVRELARFWKLPVAEKPAMPCLSSRLAYGLKVTPERLRRVDQAEQFLSELLQTRELRVRHENNDLARIEVPEAMIEQVIATEIRQTMTSHLQSLGFRYVTIDLNGLQSGSMNRILSSDELQVFDRS